MMLYVRYQVEEFAIRKWGSLDNLDEEFARREEKKKTQRDVKFSTKRGRVKVDAPKSASSLGFRMQHPFA